APAGWNPHRWRERLRVGPPDSVPLLDPADDRISTAHVRGGHDRAIADADVEDPPQLLLRHALLGEPGKHGRARPGARIDHGAEPLWEAAGKVSGDPAAGDMGEGSYIRAF